LSLNVLRNGGQLLAAGEDGFVRFYSTKDLSLIRSIRCSAASIHVAKYATDTLIFCSSSIRVEVWDLQRSTSQPVLFLESKPKPEVPLFTSNSAFVLDICVHPDQPFICAAVDSSGNFSIWDLRKNKIANQLFTTATSGDFKANPIQYALYTSKIHDGNILHAKFINTHPNFIITCSEDGSVLLLDLRPLNLNPSYIEKLQVEKTVEIRKLLTRFSSITDFTVERNIILTANDDESVSVKTLGF